MKIVFIVWLFAVAFLSTLLYRATRFEYVIVGQTLEIKLIWAGLFGIPRRIPLSNIESIRKLKSFNEIIPVLSGTFPILWGKFRPSNMLIVSLKRRDLFPIVITPDAPEELIRDVSLLLNNRTAAKSQGEETNEKGSSLDM